MKTLQFREAIAEAMSEEMRRDVSIYLMGEEVAEYNGAYKASKGMLDEFGPERVVDTPISELGFAGVGVRSEEHTSELQSREKLVCRLLLEVLATSVVSTLSLHAALPIWKPLPRRCPRK